MKSKIVMQYPGRMRSAIRLGIRMMQMANLTIMFAWAQRVGKAFVVSDDQWLNKGLAETLKNFPERSNFEYILTKLASLFRFRDIRSEILYLSPRKPNERSNCRFKGGAVYKLIGIATSFLHQEQDLIVTILLFIHALVCRLRLVSTDAINIELTDFQIKHGVRQLTDPALDGRGAVWHFVADDYDKAVEFLRMAFGDELKESDGGASYGFYDNDPDGNRDFGKLRLGFTIKPALPASV